jgi:hypothetical protein
MLDLYRRQGVRVFLLLPDDHEGDMVEATITSKRDKAVAPRLLKPFGRSRAVSAMTMPADALALRNRELVSHTTLIILKEGRRYIAGTNRRRVGSERGFSHGSKYLFREPAGAT